MFKLRKHNDNNVIYETANNSNITLRNFEGRPNQWGASNKEFCIKLDEESATMLRDDGFKVFQFKNDDPDADKEFGLSIRIGDKYPPKFNALINGKLIEFTYDMIGKDFDNMTYESFNVKFNLGKTGTAYVSEIFAVQEKSAFYDKYRQYVETNVDDVDESSDDSMPFL